MTELTAELKSCPFCGSKPFEPVPMYADNGDYGFAAYCAKRKCGTIGPLRKTERTAIVAWNTRIESKEE